MTRDAFERDGFVLLPGVLSGEDVATLRRRVDAVSVDAVPDGPYGILRHNPWPRADTAALVLRTRLAALAAGVLGVDEVVLFQDHVVWKPPGTSMSVKWHQDYSYWPLGSPSGVTAWVALDDADAANGCLHYVPGSHLRGERRPADFVAGATQPLRPDLPPLSIDEGDAIVAVPAAAGDVLLHDPLVWHMSPPNTTLRQRRAWSLTLLAAGAWWDPEHAPHPYVHALAPRAGQTVEGETFPVCGAG